jgi:hypothetical protein
MKEKSPAPQTEAAIPDNKKRARREKQSQHPFYKWVKMRRHLEDEDIERKALIQKIGDFLQEVLPSSTGRTLAALLPRGTPDTQAHVFKSEPESPAVTPLMSRAQESVFASPSKR